MKTEVLRAARAGLFAAALAGAIPASADDGADPSGPPPTEAKPGRVVTPMRWWTIPRPARSAAKDLAAKQEASVKRCLAITEGDEVIYEFHASRRTGLFRAEDFVLTSVREPRAAAEKRREEQGLRGRMKRLRGAVRPRSSPTGGPAAPIAK